MKAPWEFRPDAHPRATSRRPPPGRRPSQTRRRRKGPMTTDLDFDREEAIRGDTRALVSAHCRRVDIRDMPPILGFLSWRHRGVHLLLLARAADAEMQAMHDEEMAEMEAREHYPVPRW